LKQLFGSESLLGIAPLLTSINTVKKNLEGVKNAANFDGSMNKEYEARAATTANNIQLLKNSLTGLGITVGTMLLPAVNRFVVLSTSVVNALTDWAQQHPVLTQAIVGTTAAILALIMSWSPLASFVAVFSSLFAWFAGLPATFAAYGGMMIDGLVNGIKAKIGAAVGAVQSLAARIKGAFTSPKSMDIHSPSRVFRSYGGYITEGLALGVNSGAAQPLIPIYHLPNNLKAV
ncbi:phage tail tape measure protein, partial [Kingella kingae]|uniref:phage tail tape measure protein n=1 Tax=Kingella kingae TaxID=504 RepID=UPI0018AD3B39